MKYIDIHSHLYFPDYDADREAVIKHAQDAEIGMITVGTDVADSQKAIALAETHQNMWAIIGLHPVDAGAESAVFNYPAFKEMALNPKVIAIGECGLDYFHIPKEASDEKIQTIINSQRKIFIEHIKLANEVRKPLMLHVRNGKKGATGFAAGMNAYQDAISILKEYAKVAANFHFFVGSVADLKDIIDIGGYVSFTGVLTFARDYDELVKTAPLDRIMSETDAPFASPAPYRGARNESVYVIEIVKKIAEIRGENDSIVLPALVNNAKKFFGI